MVDEENIVTLIDEDNREVQFEHILTLDVDDNEYVVLAPLEPMEGVGEDEAIILRLDEDENGDEIYVNIEDEDEMQSVYEAYMQVMAEYEDEDYDDEDYDDDEYDE